MTETKMSLDLGNYSIKFAFDGSLVTPIRAVWAPVIQGVKSHKGSLESPVVQWAGRAQHWGHEAYKYSQGFQTLCLGEKTNQDHLVGGFYSALGMLGTKAKKVSLNLSVPNPETFKGAKLLESLHSFYWNGQPIDAEVTEVKVYHEGIAAWHYAKSLHQGIIPTKGYTLIVDVGCGTANLACLDDQGDIVGDTATFAKGGTVALANLITQHSLFRARVPGKPNIAWVVDGLANGTHCYGKGTFSWESYVQPMIDRWFDAILEYALAVFDDQLPQVERVLFVGGNVPLFRKLNTGNQMIAVCPNAGTANLRGLQLL